MALKRFASGIFALWYPIKNRSEIERFHQTLKETVTQPVLIAELSIHPENSALLNGSGMVIINPPWQIDQQILEYLPWLWKILSVHGQGRYQVSML
jgi:23S rRNA (adenine2030-N6)-methyltransferase